MRWQLTLDSVNVKSQGWSASCKISSILKSSFSLLLQMLKILKLRWMLSFFILTLININLIFVAFWKFLGISSTESFYFDWNSVWRYIGRWRLWWNNLLVTGWTFCWWSASGLLRYMAFWAVYVLVLFIIFK